VGLAVDNGSTVPWKAPAGGATSVVGSFWPGSGPAGAAGAAGWGGALLAATGVALTVELMLPCWGTDCVGVGAVVVASAQGVVETLTPEGSEVAVAHGVGAEGEGVVEGVVVGGVTTVGGGVLGAGALVGVVGGGGVVVTGGVLVVGSVADGGVSVGGVSAGGVAAGGVAAGGVAAGGVAAGGVTSGGSSTGQSVGVLVTVCCGGAHVACTTVGVAGSAIDALGASSIVACSRPRPAITHIHRCGR
jgi:hypothetical protein